MDHSLIRFLLTRAETTPQEILQAMEAGALNIDDAVRADPSLVVGFLENLAQQRSMARGSLAPPAHRQAQCKLLEHMIGLGVSPWAKGLDDLNVLSRAIATDNPQMVRMLAAHPDFPAGIFDKILHANPGCVSKTPFPEMLQALFDAGLDPQTRLQNGNTLLHETSNPAVAQFLLDNGLDPASVNKSGQDVRKWWDSRPYRTVAERQSLDDVIAANASIDKAAFIATLGEQWLDLGATVCKARIKSRLGIDPAKIVHGGLTLPEMVIASIIDQKLKPYGSPVEHRKMRRAVLSALAFCGITEPAHVAPGSSLHTALALFRFADKRLGEKLAPANFVRPGFNINRKKPDPAAKDKTAANINALLHLQNCTSPLAAPHALDAGLVVAWIERAFNAGVLQKPGKPALWHLKFNTHDVQARAGAEHASILARMLGWLTGADFYQGPRPQDPPALQALKEIDHWLDPSAAPTLLAQPRALGAVLQLFARAGPFTPTRSAVARALAALHQAVDGRMQIPGAIDPHDPWVTQAAEKLKASDDQNNADLGRRVDACVQSQLLDERTTSTPATCTAGPRF